MRPWGSRFARQGTAAPRRITPPTTCCLRPVAAPGRARAADGRRVGPAVRARQAAECGPWRRSLRGLSANDVSSPRPMVAAGGPDGATGNCSAASRWPVAPWSIRPIGRGLSRGGRGPVPCPRCPTTALAFGFSIASIRRACRRADRSGGILAATALTGPAAGPSDGLDAAAASRTVRPAGDFVPQRVPRMVTRVP